MNKLSRFLLGLSLVFTCSCITAAQEKSQANPSIPRVLQITREFTKPGKAGFVHDASESAFVHAMARAKWPNALPRHDVAFGQAARLVPHFLCFI
jgi:hypothetical protein